MKEITREVTKTEVTGYQAYDGTFFREKEECEKYERTAKAVIGKRVREFMIANTSEITIFDAGSDECDFEIYKVETIDQAKDLMMYIEKSDIYGKEWTTEEMVGKEICLWFNYDRDGVTITTLEHILGNIKDTYYAVIEKHKEKKNEN